MRNVEHGRCAICLRRHNSRPSNSWMATRSWASEITSNNYKRDCLTNTYTNSCFSSSSSSHLETAGEDVTAFSPDACVSIDEAMLR